MDRLIKFAWNLKFIKNGKFIDSIKNIKLNKLNRRKREEAIAKVLMIISTLIIVASLVLIMGTVLIKGLPAINLAMVTQIPKAGFYLGGGGGILNAILGSLYLSGGATLLAILLSLPIVLYLNLYLNKTSSMATFIRFSFDVLWGVPSIVYGAFGFTIMLFLGLRTSLLGGIIAVAMLILPIMSRTIDEIMRMVPKELMEASYSLGATKLETGLRVLIRQTMPGILTAILIAFGRGIGDAASVLFTAGFTDYLPQSLFRPAATLPLAIFFQLGTPIHEVQERAYASALILTLIILIISVSTRILSKRFKRNMVK